MIQVMRQVIIAVGAATVLAACSSSASPGPEPASSHGSSASRPETAARLTFNSDHLLFGTAQPTFSAGAPGKLRVVYVGPLSHNPSGDSTLPIAVRNNTSKAVSHIDLTASVRNKGKLVATGKSQEVQPAQLKPGEVGLSYIYFELNTTQPPAGASYSFSSETMPADTSSYNTSTLRVTEANRSGGSVVGTATNNTGKAVEGPYKVDVFCFTGVGKLRAVVGTFTDQDGKVGPSGEVTFTADLYGASCPKFVVGVTGFFA